MTKQKLKNIIGSWYSAFDYPILVNSYGRSGSTVLTKSIIKCAIGTKNKVLRDIAYRSISQEAWDLEKVKLQKGIVYKTHDYPPAEKFEGEIRVLYTYSDPIDVVRSLLRLYKERGEDWMQNHYDHLKVPYTDFKDIVNNDQLHLEKHLESWLHEDRFPIAFIKYEEMWNHQEDISNFLGFKVELPPYRERSGNNSKHEKLTEKLKYTYGSLRQKIKNLNSFFTLNTRESYQF